MKKEIQKLKNNVNTVEKLDVTRKELNDLENELCWATVNIHLNLEADLYFYKE